MASRGLRAHSGVAPDMVEPHVIITEMKKEDSPFLRRLWYTPEVMRFADEFPGLRHWSKASGVERAWKAYQKWRTEWGDRYTQLIVRLPDATPIGESFVAPLQEGFTFGRWKKPDSVRAVMGDIKLMPPYWGRGYGTEGMRQVVKFVFTRTDCELFIVPPHVHGNPAAVRVYEKAGFVPTSSTVTKSKMGHRIMELWRTRYEELY